MSKLMYKENKLWSYSLFFPFEALELKTSQLVSGVVSLSLMLLLVMVVIVPVVAIVQEHK